MRNNPSIHIFADLPADTAYRRGVLMGAAAYCHEYDDVDMLSLHSEPALMGDPERIDGILTTINDAAARNAAANITLPIVNVSSAFEELPCRTVCPDSEAMGLLAAEHLMEQGYTHFAYHLDSRIAFSRHRLTGFSTRLREAGHPCTVFDSEPLGAKGRNAGDVRAATSKWLQELMKPVGVFTHSDARAAALLDICREVGVAVPNDVGIIGNDNDTIICSSTRPTLTSIDNAPDLIGYRAAGLLVSMVRGNQPAVRAEFVAPRRVVERQSTQPAAVDDERLRMAMRFIRAHAADRISVDDVVRHVSLSRRTLERRFHTHLARSPGDEIRRVQVERARYLLTETTLKLSEVAIAVGYARFTSFATAFSAVQGKTPKEYRAAFHAR